MSTTTTTSSSSSSKRKALPSLIAGATAGATNTIICCPLDVAKVRMQVQGSMGVHKYRGILGSVQLIFREEGIRGLFKGLGPALMTVPCFWGIYFYSYDYLKENLHQRPTFSASPTFTHIVSAVCAGAIGDVITNPLWVLRTRIQTLALHEMEYGTTRMRGMNMLEIAKEIYTKEGVLAFYKGLSASFLGLTHVALQFPLYERFKQHARERRVDNKETFFDVIVASISSKYIATIITYPHEVIRARMQDHRVKNPSIVMVTKEMIVNEGILTMWVGLRVNLVRVIPSTMSTFLCYEYITRYLKTRFPG